VRSRLKTTDGLRALAIIAVAGFHTFPKLAPGGFVGVDVFFVISGFVISLVYEPPLTDGTTAFGAFYLRRVRRLAPAYFVLVLAVSAAALFIMRPRDLTNYGWSLIFQGFYAQNIAFWNIGDYFDSPLAKPLLHTWSLAVEEQFYLLFPAFILLVRRFPRARDSLLIVAAVTSLLIGWKIASVSPKTSFYWLLTRVWEFAAGILAARRYQLNPVTGPAGKVLVAAGTIGILAAVLLFDERSAIPSLQTLLAVGGATAILLAQDAGATAIYTNPVAQHFGRISYSWYLWHWPPLSLYFLAYGRMPGVPMAIMLAGLGYGLGFASYALVERRTRRLGWHGQTAIALVSSFCLCAILGGVLILRSGGFVRSYPPMEKALLAAQLDVPPYRCPLLRRLAMWNREVCRINDLPGRPILLIGDSHADSFKAPFSSFPLLITKQNCTAMEYDERPNCDWAAVMRDVRDLRVRRIILIAHWSRTYSDEQYQRLKHHLAAVAVPVTILLPTPEGVEFDPATYLRSGTYAATIPVTGEQVKIETASFRAAMGSIAREDKNVTLVDPIPILCPSQCIFALRGTPIYRDANHLTIDGARLLAPHIAQSIVGSSR
jgi:peptidoglycan/LPS O-acetylase OafA/YrhL